MRAWGSCAVSMLASAFHPARSFVPAAVSFRGAPLVARSLRRPLSSGSNVLSSSSSSSNPRGSLGSIQRRAVWVVQAGALDARNYGGRVRAMGMSSSSGGAVQEPQVDAGVGQEWTSTKV